MSGTDNYTLTPHYSYIKPISLADDDLWGDHINLNWDSLDAKLYQIEFNGNYLPLAGGIMRGGISFGTMIGGSSTDLTKHISLYGGNTGFSVSGGGRLNYNTPSGFSHYFVCAGADVMQLNGSGLAVNANLSVTNTASFGTTASPAQMNFGNNTATSAAFWIAGAVGAGRQIVWTSAGARRWIVGMGAGTEPGSNGGGDWFLQRWADDGTTNLGSAILVTRSTGAVTLSGALTAPGTVTTGNLNAGPTGAVNSYSTFGNATTPNNQLNLNGAAGVNRGLMWMSATVSRWQFVVNGAEGGANAGGNMNLIRYDDSGTNIGNSLTFTRSTGLGTVAGDPTAALGIATKQYVDARGPFLPLAGGFTTGNVGIGAAPPANAAASTLTAVTQIEARNLNVNAYLDNTAGGPVWRYIETGGAAVLNYGPGTTGLYLNSAPPGTAGAPITFNGQLVFDTGGNAAVNHNFSAAVNITAGNTVTAGGAVIANGNYVGLASGAFMQSDASYTYFRCDTAGWGWVYTRSNGNMQYQRGSDYVALFNIDAGGTITNPGNLRTAGNAMANLGLYPDSTGNWALYSNGSVRIQQFTGSWSWQWTIANGQYAYFIPGGTQYLFSVADYISYNWLAGQAGVGAYVVTSDERTKADVAPAPHGLDAILAIEPVTFRRWHMAEKRFHDRVELGFGARQIKAVLPEAVVVMDAPDDWRALAGDDEPILGVQSDAIVAALCNAVKTLNSRLAALEQRTLH